MASIASIAHGQSAEDREKSLSTTLKYIDEDIDRKITRLEQDRVFRHLREKIKASLQDESVIPLYAQGLWSIGRTVKLTEDYNGFSRNHKPELEIRFQSDEKMIVKLSSLGNKDALPEFFIQFQKKVFDFPEHLSRQWIDSDKTPPLSEAKVIQMIEEEAAASLNYHRGRKARNISTKAVTIGALAGAWLYAAGAFGQATDPTKNVPHPPPEGTGIHRIIGEP